MGIQEILQQDKPTREIYEDLAIYSSRCRSKEYIEGIIDGILYSNEDIDWVNVNPYYTVTPTPNSFIINTKYYTAFDNDADDFVFKTNTIIISNKWGDIKNEIIKINKLSELLGKVVFDFDFSSKLAKSEFEAEMQFEASRGN